MVLSGRLVNADLEIGRWIVTGLLIWVAWLVNGGVKAKEILSNNVMMNVGDEKVSGFFGDLSVN